MLRSFAFLLACCAPALAAIAPPPKLLAAAKSGDAGAQDRLGMWYDDGGDGGAAVAWYRRAAALGHAGGLHHMGVMSEGGPEAKGSTQDCAASRDYYRQAFAKGVAASAFRLGYQSYRGACAEKDYNQARDWFEKSGTAMGLFYIGLMREHGQGGPADTAGAAELYERAYRGGVTRAANQLAHLYFDASPRDAEKAFLWYLRGAKEADAQDRERLAALRRELPAAGRRRAERDASR